MNPLLLRLPRLLACLLLAPGVAAAKDRVALQSKADPGYVRARGDDGQPQVETYVFSEGRRFAGVSRDGGLDQATFESIVRTLATDLARQNYRPTRDAAAADLVIVVHWGTTYVGTHEENVETMADVSRVLAGATGGTDAAELRFLQRVAETGEMAQSSDEQRNAKLLGFDAELAAEQRKFRVTPSSKEERMRTELSEERYFVILMAWDNRALRERKQKRLLWSTRFSMRAPGISFGQALPALSKFAGDYFGRDLPGLATGVVRRQEAIVEIGETEVIGEAVPPR